MKKFLSAALICLLFCTLTASANEYGLKGGVINIVEGVDAYDGYSVAGEADDGSKWVGDRYVNQAVLENRYHALLIAAWRDGDTWRVDTASTTAVYQPGDERGEYPNTPGLSHFENGFTLTYGEKEQYHFVWQDGAYVLQRVLYGMDEYFSDSYLSTPEGFQFWQSGMADTFTPIGDAIWHTDGITLGEFNITQTPRSLAELRRLNAVRALFDESEAYHTPVLGRSGDTKAQKLAVYSAPDTSSYRSSSGKASMSTGGAYQVWGVEDGWTLISYEVSLRTCRIGYVQAELTDSPALTWADIPLTAAVDTFLTDDPFCSQYAQANIPAGTVLTGLTRVGEYYAYVAWEQDGQPIRGFVPLKDLQPLYDTALSVGQDALYADVRWDVMDALIGKWSARDGADRTRMIFYADGVYRNHMPGDGSTYREEGNFRVYDDGRGDYVLLIRTEDNRETRYGLTLNLDGTISLTDEDGAHIYVREEYSSIGNG